MIPAYLWLFLCPHVPFFNNLSRLCTLMVMNVRDLLSGCEVGTFVHKKAGINISLPGSIKYSLRSYFVVSSSQSVSLELICNLKYKLERMKKEPYIIKIVSQNIFKVLTLPSFCCWSNSMFHERTFLLLWSDPSLTLVAHLDNQDSGF